MMEVVEFPEDVNPPRSNQFTVDDLDIEILPLIYEIIRSVEKDPYDTTQKAKESQDTSHKILELQKKLDSVRSQIKRLPGIEYSKEEQLEKLETLRKQLRLKRELLLKYQDIKSLKMVLKLLTRYLLNNERVINKLADSRAMRRAAQLIIYYMSRMSSMSGAHRLPLDPKLFGTHLRSIARRLASNVREEIQDAKEKLKKN